MRPSEVLIHMHSAKPFLSHIIWILGGTSVWGDDEPCASSFLMAPQGGTLCPIGKSKFLLGYFRLTDFIVVLDREQGNCACSSMCTLELFL